MRCLKSLLLYVVLLFHLPARAQYGGGSGTENDPYLIYTAEQLNTIGTDSNDWDKHFKLMADIDLSTYTGTDFNIIGIDFDSPFAGVFDGNGHTISNFTYTSTGRNQIGLFGYLEGATIKGLGLIDPNVDAGSGRDVGSLVGYLRDGRITACYVEGGRVSASGYVGGLAGRIHRGTITNCRSTASVTGDGQVAGLVGDNYGGTLANCYSTSSVTGDRYVAGLVACNWHPGDIVNCYAGGDITGNEYAGGLVGRNSCREFRQGKIRSCYSVGRVTANTYVGGLVGSNCGVVEFCFWDVQTSRRTISHGGTGKTTAEMQTAGTFLEAGWDFVGESENGTEDTWAICDGGDYPRLSWEFVIGDFDSDADTDLVDFCILAEHWLAADGSFWCGQGCDLTNDGSVNWQDLMVFADNWLR